MNDRFTFPEPLQRFLPKALRDDSPIVSVVRLSGVISVPRGVSAQGLSIGTVSSALRAAFSYKPAKAVAILVNSPGGSPVQSHLIYKRIRQLAEEKKLPVYVFVEDVAASGGYMIACAGDEIIADQSSILGSIGVVSAGFGFPEALKKLGVERRVYTAGTSKAQLDPFQPEKPEEIAHLKAIQEEIHEFFINLVKERRGDVIDEDHDKLFSGQFWAGQSAQKLGLCDRIGDLRSVMRERFGDKVKFRLFSQERGLFGRRKASVGLGLDRFSRELPEATLQSLEERSLWSRYGL